METRFTAMDISSSRSRERDGALDESAPALSLLPGWSTLSTISPRDVACDMVTTVSGWTSAVLGPCFSRMRRVQFDEEHQRSLLSCHSTEETFALPDEAMLELRRRVQMESYRQPSASTYANYGKTGMYPKRERARQEEPFHSDYMQTAGFVSRDGSSKRRQLPRITKKRNPEDDGEEQPELGVLLSDAEKTLNDILGSNKRAEMHPEQNEPSPRVKEDDVRRLSVDELLAMNVAARGRRAVSAPEKSACDNQAESDSPSTDEEYEITEEGRGLREWLSAIDPVRSSDYAGYARSFEKQGFHSVDDLAQLDEQEVEMAMSEVGISKFAHRTRIRKAVLRLHSSGSIVSNSSTGEEDPKTKDADKKDEEDNNQADG